jgi:hypothetical protein
MSRGWFTAEGAEILERQADQRTNSEALGKGFLTEQAHDQREAYVHSIYDFVEVNT